MYDEGTKKAAMQVAWLLERLSRMSTAMETRHQRINEQHERTVQSLPGILRQAADQTLGTMAADASRSLRRGLDEPLRDLARQASEHQRLMLASTDAMLRMQHKLARFVNKAIWLVAGVLVILLPVVVAGGYLGWHYEQIVAQQKIEADLLRAYNKADVRLCGSQLCARVDRADKRFGEFLPIRSRPE